MRQRRGGSFVGTLLAIIAIGVILVVAIGYGRGWIQFTDTEDRVNIEIDKNAAKSDANRAVEEAEDAVDRAGHKIKDATNNLRDDFDGVEEDLEDTVDEPSS